ncbi:MAG: preprotein translocase subunit YajC [Bryobacteraceae bacterium]
MSILAFILQSAPASGNPLGSLFLPVAMLAVMYFVIFLPMQRQKKAQAQMLSNLQPGMEVVTNGGIMGTIVSLADDTLIVRVKPDNVKLQMSRAAIASVLNQTATEEKK